MRRIRDDQGRVQEEVWQNEKGELTSRRCREYNSNGTYTTTEYTFSDNTKHNPR
jgi:hypothetical protein